MTRPADLDNLRPIHAQISDALRASIRSGELAVGQRLPGEGDLAESFSASRGTIRHALRTLNEEGTVQTFPGRGTFVISGKPEPSIGQRLIGLGEALSYSEKSLTTAVVSMQILEPDTHGTYEEFCAADEHLILLDRIRYLDDVPVARLKNWIRGDLAPGIESVDFSKTSLFHALDAHAVREVTSGRREFEAVLPEEDVANSLSVAISQPLLFLRQVTYLEDGEPIERSDVWMDSKQVAVSVMLSR